MTTFPAVMHAEKKKILEIWKKFNSFGAARMSEIIDFALSSVILYF